MSIKGSKQQTEDAKMDAMARTIKALRARERQLERNSAEKAEIEQEIKDLQEAIKLIKNIR